MCGAWFVCELWFIWRDCVFANWLFKSQTTADARGKLFNFSLSQVVRGISFGKQRMALSSCVRRKFSTMTRAFGQRRRNSRHGTTVVETALVLPVFLLFSQIAAKAPPAQLIFDQ